jgi:hypothetical protein
MTALVTVTAVQSPGLVMVLKIAPTRPMAVTLPVMIMTVVTAKVALMVAPMVVVMYMDVQTQMHVTMILTLPWMMIVAKN